MTHQIHTIDLEFMGAGGVIGCFLVPCPEGGFVLLESGPASTIETLERAAAGAGFDLGDLRAVAVTHVHLDHAGAAGTLARRTGALVLTHPEGARHLHDPADKLLPSAERLYGSMMEPLWGRTEPVPADRLRHVAHGEAVVVEGLELRAWLTPGHAVHHVAWQVGDAVATGDVAGVRFRPATHVLPPTPPPDIQIHDWRRSLELLRELRPGRLLLTHFGAFDDPRRHLEELDDRLVRWSEIAGRAAAAGSDRRALAAELLALDEDEMAAAEVPPDAEQRYRRLCPMDANAAGLLRAATTGA